MRAWICTSYSIIYYYNAFITRHTSGLRGGGAGRISGGNFCLMNFELFTFLCR